jgi:hypothetical protein
MSVVADIFASVMAGLAALHTLNLVAGDLTTVSVVGCSRTSGAVVWRPDARHARPCPLDGGSDRRAADVLAAAILTAEMILRHVAIAGYEREEPETATAEQRADVVRRACRRVATVSRALASCLRRCCASDAVWRPSSLLALHLVRAARDDLTSPRNPNPELVAFLDFVFSAFTDAVGCCCCCCFFGWLSLWELYFLAAVTIAGFAFGAQTVSASVVQQATAMAASAPSISAAATQLAAALVRHAHAVGCRGMWWAFYRSVRTCVCRAEARCYSGCRARDSTSRFAARRVYLRAGCRY